MSSSHWLPELAENGIDVIGVTTAQRYDAVVGPPWRAARWLPTARSAVLLGCGGSRLFRAARGAPDWDAGPDPVDRFTRRWVERQRDAWRAEGFATESALYADRRSDGDRFAFADFAALAAACGLGTPSRLRILLHPRFGPWWSIRGLLLTERALAPTPPLAWDPCDGCPAPCADACPGAGVFAARGPLDVAACFETRRARADCRAQCASRRACVVGRDAAYEPDAERYFAQSAWRHRGAALTGPSTR